MKILLYYFLFNKKNRLLVELKSLIAQQNTRLEKLEKLTLALKLNPDSEVISLAKQD